MNKTKVELATYIPFLRSVETVYILDNGERIGEHEFSKVKAKFDQANQQEIEELIVRLEDLLDKTTKSVVSVFQNGKYDVYNFLSLDFNALKHPFPKNISRDIPVL